MFKSNDFQLYYDFAVALIHKNREDRAENEIVQSAVEDQAQIIKTLKAHLACQQVSSKTKHILEAIRLGSKNLSGLLTNYTSPPKMLLTEGQLPCQNWFSANMYR
jgi:hypothetical protein